uniref:Uncharacterized protein n=1 Tax=Acrobeloides nanus TaxID=290746 RepID=A0A914C3D2_9BILA
MFVLLIFFSFQCIYVFAHSDPAYLVNGQVHVPQPMKKLAPKLNHGHVHAGNVKVKRPQQILKAAKAEASETVETIDLSPSEVGIPLEPPYRSVNLGAVELDIPGLGGVQDVQVQSGADLFDYNAEDSPQ